MGEHHGLRSAVEGKALTGAATPALCSMALIGSSCPSRLSRGLTSSCSTVRSRKSGRSRSQPIPMLLIASAIKSPFLIVYCPRAGPCFHFCSAQIWLAWHLRPAVHADDATCPGRRFRARVWWSEGSFLVEGTKQEGV